MEQKPLKVYITASKEMGYEGYPEYPNDYVIGELPNIRLDNRGELLKPDEYDPLTKDDKRCSHFKSERTETLAKIMNDEEEHPIVRGLAKEEYLRRLIRDYVPNTREGETKETKMAKVLENVINNCGFSQSEMAKHFCQYAHRYLDESLFDGFIRYYILIHAKKWRDSKPGTGPMFYDPRNKYACEACNKIVDALEWDYYLTMLKD